MTAWDFPSPHLIELTVQAADIDAYGHVNNAVYLTWLDRVAWSHSAALGIPVESCLSQRRGMAAQRIEIEYLRAARAHDAVQVATWIMHSDARLRVGRRFQVWRGGDGQTMGGPALNVYEEGDQLTVEAQLPGLKPEDLSKQQ